RVGRRLPRQRAWRDAHDPGGGAGDGRRRVDRRDRVAERLAREREPRELRRQQACGPRPGPVARAGARPARDPGQRDRPGLGGDRRVRRAPASARGRRWPDRRRGPRRGGARHPAPASDDSRGRRARNALPREWPRLGRHRPHRPRRLAVHMSGQGSHDRAALVTGGARGIGLAIVEALAARGDRVTIADVDLENARASAADLEQRGRRVSAVALDVTDVEQVHRVLGEVDADAALTTVVCNAGLAQLGGVLDTSVEQYDRVLAVNLKGVFFTMQAALRLMVPRGTGSVVSISSTSGFTASSTPQAVYDLSKAAVRMLTTSAARETGRTGVRVNAVAPGTVGTDLVRDLLSKEAIARLSDERIPLGRLAEPREIAAAVAWLCSDEASYVTGHTLVADGGW